jgi:hypothetical protein
MDFVAPQVQAGPRLSGSRRDAHQRHELQIRKLTVLLRGISRRLAGEGMPAGDAAELINVD